MHAPSPPRPAIWRALGLGAVFLLVAASAAIALISSGRLDPALPGPLQAELGPQTVAAGAEETALLWQEAALPEPPLTVRLQATSTGAETVAYGLALGAPDDYLAVVVSPAGYRSVARQRAGEREEVLLWHAPLGEAPPRNVEIQVDVHEDGQARVWVARQEIWEGEWPGCRGRFETCPDGAGRQVGLLARAEGGAATVVFERVALFGP